MKKESLEVFLNSRSYSEITFFSTYRQAGFMYKSQNKINKELEKRNLGKSQLNDLMNKSKKATLENCLRCQYSNFMRIVNTELKSSGYGYGYGGYEVKINSKKCKIYGYNAQKNELLY